MPVLKLCRLLNADGQHRGDGQSDQEGGEVDADLVAEEDGRAEHDVGLRHHGGGGRGLEDAELCDVLLRAWDEGRIAGGHHLTADRLDRLAERGPVVVGQPERNLDVKDVEQLDEVVGPAGADGAGAHGVLQREVPADDPGDQISPSVA